MPTFRGLVAGLLFAMLSDSLGQQVQPQDLDTVLQRADALLEEAKTAYEDARSKSSVPAYIDAGFKLEDARIKYIVLQEIGSPEKQKIAAERLRSVNQLSKLIHDGKVAISGNPGESAGSKKADVPDSAPVKDPLPGAPATPPARDRVVDVTKRFPVPDAVKQKEAEKLIKDLFKEQYAKKGAADRKALIRLLLQHADKSQDDTAGMWVLCQEAQELAVQVCDVNAAVEAVDLAARSFDVDAMAMKQAALLGASKTAKAPEESLHLARRLLSLVDDLLRADQYDAADKAASLAIQHAKKSSNVALVGTATHRAKELAEAKSRYNALKGVLQTLAKTPDDPTANLEMGKFLCFVKGNWDLGLRFLVKGSDATLRGLAERELAFPTQTGDLVALADGWFDLADKEKNPLSKGQLQSHARFYYESALSEASGLSRAKIEKRLETLANQPSSGPAVPFVDLLSLIDLKRDVVMGDWSLDAKGLLCTRIVHSSRVQLPYEPPEEYDLMIVGERKEGNAPIFIGLAQGTTQFTIAIDDWGGTQTGLGNIDGKNHKESETAVKGRLLKNDKPATMVCSVRRSEVSLTLDGKRIFTFKAGYDRLSLQPNLTTPNKRALSVGCGNARFLVSKMTVTHVSGQGKILR